MTLSHIVGANDKTLCNLPVEGNWVVTSNPTCQWCRNTQTLPPMSYVKTLDQLLSPQRQSALISLEEFDAAIAVLWQAKNEMVLDRFSSGARALRYSLAVKILDNAIGHLTRRLQQQVVGHK